MAEPGLSLGFTNIRLQVAQALGIGRDSSNWSVDETTILAEIIDSGVRQFYHPPVLPSDKALGNMQPHKWSFLEPVETITIWGDITGTVSGTPTYDGATYSTITATADKFFDVTMIGKTFTFDTSSVGYVIAGYTSATIITVTGDASGETADDTFSIASNGDFPMEDDFGDAIGPMTLGADEGYAPVTRVSESDIRARRQTTSDTTGTPQYFAIQVQTTDQTVTQRYNMLIWPEPDGDYSVSFKKRVLLDKITASYPYPWGTQPHAETVLQSCLAIAEERMDGERGVHYVKFLERLEASVGYDRDVGTPDVIGYNSEGSESGIDVTRVRYVTYNNVLYEG